MLLPAPPQPRLGVLGQGTLSGSGHDTMSKPEGVDRDQPTLPHSRTPLEPPLGLFTLGSRTCAQQCLRSEAYARCPGCRFRSTMCTRRGQCWGSLLPLSSSYSYFLLHRAEIQSTGCESNSGFGSVGFLIPRL